MMDAKERKVHLMQLHTSIANNWHDIEKELDYRIEKLTRRMIDTENVKVAIAIKELEDLKQLPAKVIEEITRLDTALPPQDGATVVLDDG